MSAVMGTFVAKSGIYKILNTANGKFYIGSAVDIKQRWRQHRSSLNLGYHDNSLLQRSWKKYGEDKFTFEVLEYVSDVNLLISIEQNWMDKSNACDKSIGFNICKIAGSRLGFKSTEETKLKISTSKKGAKLSDETKRRMSVARQGIKFTAERNMKISLALKGRKRSPEECLQMSIVRTGIKRTPHTEETKLKISSAQKGRVVSAEKRAMISATLTGRKWSPARRKAYEDSL